MQRPVVFWLVAVVFPAVVLYLLRDVLLPFVAGFALAYLLDPVADRLERAGIGRLGATVAILAAFVVLLVLLLILLLPLAAHQLALFVDKIPGMVSRLQEVIATQGAPILDRLGGREALGDVQNSLGDLVKQGIAWGAAFLKGLWSGGAAVLSVFGLVVVTPVVAFYLLVDWDRMVATVDGWVPLRHRDTVRRLAREIDAAISGFVRGQAAVCLILGTFYAVGLTLVGLNFGILIGLLSGLLTFIPYVGSLTGLVLSVGVAVVQFWPNWTWILATLAIFVTGQFIEGNILSPKLVGASVGLHPVWLMFALLAFGSLFGFVGLLLAVPLTAIIGVLARFALSRYLLSPVYTGHGMPPPPSAATSLPRPENDA